MKGNKCFGLLLLFFTIFGVSLSVSLNVNAVSIDSNIYSTAVYTKNFESTKTRTNIGPVTSPLYVLNVPNPTGLWDYQQALSFPNPYSNKTGTGFASSVYFTMHSTTGNFLNTNISRLMAKSVLGFENLDENRPYCTQTWRANIQDASTVQFLLESSCPAGTFPSGTNFSQVQVDLDFSPDSIFWCANDNPSRLCPSNIGVTLYNIDYYFNILTTEQESYNQTIINQNQTIINQNNQTNQYLSEQAQKDQQDRDDLQNASEDADSGANSAQNQAQTAGTTLLKAFSDFVGAISNASATNCIIDADMGNLDLGEIDLCQLALPQPFQVLASLTVIGFCVPLSIATAKKLIALIRSFQ